jgi:hypothetical protein
VSAAPPVTFAAPPTPTGEIPSDRERLAEDLVPIAAELVGTVRDYGPADIAAVLARVPQGRHDALAVVLAAMVDPDRTPAELLDWVASGPVQSREGFTPGRRLALCPDCGEVLQASSLRRHRGRVHEYERLVDAGVNPGTARVLAPREAA